MTDSATYRKALAERSSYVENVLVHRMIAPGRRDLEGNRKTRLHYRDVKRNKFQGPLTTAQLLDALFGDVHEGQTEQQTC